MQRVVPRWMVMELVLVPVLVPVLALALALVRVRRLAQVARKPMAVLTPVRLRQHALGMEWAHLLVSLAQSQR